MKKRILSLLGVLLLLITLWQPPAARASSPLEPDRSGSITVHYAKDGTAFADLDISIYRVAEAFADGTFELIQPYRSYPVNIHGITSQTEWQTAATTLAAYISANQHRPDHTAKTDAAGKVTFSNLKTGLYLVKGVTAENNNGIYLFEDFLLYLPTPQEDGSFSYDVEAKPKCIDYTPKTEYTVRKLWKDSGYKNKRPKSITVDILKDGIVQSTQTLSASNDWTYTWYVPNGSGTWTVVETDVPDPYKVSIKKSETTFTITNTYPSQNTDSPKTGDTFPLWTCILVMCFSGFALMAIGIWYGRRRG